jgi:hypothetical protein
MASLSHGLDVVTPARLYIVVLITALIVLHGVIPKHFLVDGTTVGLVGIVVVIALVPLLKSASLPGGTGLNFREDLNRLELESSIAEAEQPVFLVSAHADLLSPIADASDLHDPSERSADDVISQILREAAQSPRVGLIRLSAELERAVRTVLFSSGWGNPESARPLRRGIERLVELGVLTRSAASALALFQEVRNQIVHGNDSIPDEDALRALDAGIPLLRAVLAIPRERNVVHHPGVALFSDGNASKEMPGVKGLILKTTSPGGAITEMRIFPTTRGTYVVGRQVTWEWDSTRSWHEAWYRDPDTGAVKKAWDGSLEFVGRHLDDT